MKKIREVAFSLIITLIIGSSIFFGYFLMQDRIVTIASPSMAPTIMIGDMVIYSEYSPNSLKPDPVEGDIVVIDGPEYYYERGLDPFLWNYLPNQTKIIHRIINKQICNETGELVYETKGDNNLYSDGCLKGFYQNGYGEFILNISDPILVPRTAIVGEVDLILPKLGVLAQYFFKITLGVIILLIIFSIMQRRGYNIKFEKTLKT